MAKTPDFINPTVPKTINTVAGTAHYVKIEVEDHLGRWNDNYYTRDGYWVIHKGNHHHVYKIPLKGKGWREAPGRDGKAPKHKEVATRAQAKGAQNTPMKKMIKKAYQRRNKWIASTLLNDEASTGTQMVEYFISNGLSREDAEFYVSQRSDARRNPLGFRLKLKTNHRKLTEKERDRMVDMWASAPLTYKPAIDDELIKLGLAQFWDNMPDAVENTDMPFYADNGRILPEWYDFKAETARHDAKRAAKAKEKHTSPYRVDVWEERDRLIITVYDANDKEVVSWVDEDAREMFEDGFFDSKDLEQSVLEYLKNHKIIKGG